MRDYVVHEYIKCDICGNDMGFETNGVTSHDTSVPNGTLAKCLKKTALKQIGKVQCQK